MRSKARYLPYLEEADSNGLTAVPSSWVANRRFVIFEMSKANPKNLRSRMYGRSDIANKPVWLREDPCGALAGAKRQKTPVRCPERTLHGVVLQRKKPVRLREDFQSYEVTLSASRLES